MRFQLITGVFAVGLLSCNSTPVEVPLTEQNGTVSFRIEATGSSQESPAASSLPLQFELVLTSGSDTVRSSHSAGAWTEDFSLHPGPWKAKIQSVGDGELRVYEDSMFVQVISGETSLERWTLDARVSDIHLNFPVVDSINRIIVSVDGMVKRDTSFTKQSLLRQTIPFCVRVSASRQGISHTLSLKVRGSAWGLDTVLYALDTSVVAISGSDPLVPLLLRWVGPSAPPDGQAALRVQLGVPGTVAFVVSYVDTATGRITDPRDGFRYKVRWIGRQRWMMANLGDCDSCLTKGRIYPYEKMDTLCPVGWHVPDTSEWLRLFRAVAGGGSDKEGLYRLKNHYGWNGYGNLLGRWSGDNAIGFGLNSSHVALESIGEIYNGEEFGQYLTSTPGVPFLYIHGDAFEFTRAPGMPVQNPDSPPQTRSAVRCLAD
ncbi:MAG: hypothetical protein IPN71_09500 [Fibrobacteres bacterium]|nr:hypothetical protein [Fibrobacterota bacterium]